MKIPNKHKRTLILIIENMSNFERKSPSLLAVLGSGGHTTEMLKMVESLDCENYRKTFVHANTDSMSAKKLLALPTKDFRVRILHELL